MKTNLEIKKNHHYVWKRYLKGWHISSEKKEIFYLNSKKTIFSKSASALAVGKKFYTPNRLNEDCVKFIKEQIKKGPSSLHDFSLKFLNDFLILQYMHENPTIYPLNEYEKNSVNSYLKNYIEDAHSKIEEKMVKILEDLITGNLDILKSSEHLPFFFMFLGQQCMRTLKVKDFVYKNISPELTQLNERKIALLKEVNEKAWPILSYIYGHSLGVNLFNSRHNDNHFFLINKTSVPFITSDQPVINLHKSAVMGGIIPPECLDLYFPLSPTYAYMIHDTIEHGRGETGKSKQEIYDSKIIEKLNRSIAAKSYQSIYSNCKKTIENTLSIK